jgi:hypothetical protein
VNASEPLMTPRNRQLREMRCTPGDRAWPLEEGASGGRRDRTGRVSTAGPRGKEGTQSGGRNSDARNVETPPGSMPLAVAIGAPGHQGRPDACMRMSAHTAARERKSRLLARPGKSHLAAGPTGSTLGVEAFPRTASPVVLAVPGPGACGPGLSAACQRCGPGGRGVLARDPGSGGVSGSRGDDGQGLCVVHDR